MKHASDRLTLYDRAVLAAAIIVPGMMGAVATLGNLLVLPLIQEFHASRAQVIFLVEVGMFGNLILGPIVGRVLVRVAPWVILLTGAAIAIAALTLAGFGRSLGVAATGYILAQAFGFGLCGLNASQTFVVRHYPDRLGIVSGTTTVVSALTGMVLSLTVPRVIVEQGWRTAVLMCAVVLLLALPLPIVTLLRRRPVGAVRQAIAEPAVLGIDEIAAVPTTLQILAMPRFWLLILSIIPVAICALSVAVNVLPFMAERGWDTQQASIVLAVIGIASALGALLVGAIVQRFHPARVIAVIAGVASLCLAAIATGFGNPAIFFVVMYVGLAGVAPSLSVGVERLFGARAYSPVVGLVGPFLLFGAFSGAGTGWLRDHLGSYLPVFGILSAITAVAVIAAVLLSRYPLVGVQRPMPPAPSG